MAALTQSRMTPSKNGDSVALIVAAAAQVYLGGMVCMDVTGTAVAASASVTLKTLGIADADAAAGEGVNALKGVFAFGNSAAADLLTKADIGADCYVVDDQTVAKTSAVNTRPKAGRVFDVDDYGVWVQFI